MAWYTRQSTALIVNGLTIEASNHNNEYNAIVNAFDNAFSTTSGHTHNGTGDNGAKLNHLSANSTIHSSSQGPGTAQDSAAGYTEGDLYWNTSSFTYWWCTDNSDGAAAWSRIGTTAEVTTLSAALTSLSGTLKTDISTVSGNVTTLSGTLKSDITTLSGTLKTDISTVSGNVSTLSAVVTALSAGSFNMGIDTYTTSGVTLSAGSNGKYLNVTTDAGVFLLTIPTSGAVALPVGAECVVFQQGTSKVSITGTPTINSFSGARFIKAQYTAVTLKKAAADHWHIIGSVSGS